jgi:hypothetical protein
MSGDRIMRDDRGDEWAALFRPRDGTISCPPPELVQAAGADALPADLQQAISTHVAGCRVCAVLAESLALLPAATPAPDELRRIRRRIQGRADAARPAWRARWLAAAAAVVMVTSLGAWVFFRGRGPHPGEPAARSGSRDPSSVFALERAPLLPPTAGGTDDAISPAERGDLAAALLPYRAGDFREASRRLGAFVAKYPHRAEGHFYLGVSQLVLESNVEAVAALQTAERLAMGRAGLAREVRWYLALAYRRAGRNDEAWEQLARLCRDPWGGSRRACDGLAELARPVRLSGVVTDVEGRPIAGAVVSEHSAHPQGEMVFTAPTQFTATTDAAGSYEASDVPWSPSGRLLVRATAPGYFSSTAMAVGTPQTRLDFTLYPLRYIREDDVVSGTTTDHPMCELSTEPCQRYALIATRSGTLEISVAVSARTGIDLYVETPDGNVYGPQLAAPLRLQFRAAAGDTFQIRVLSFNGPREFELTTRMRP